MSDIPPPAEEKKQELTFDFLLERKNAIALQQKQAIDQLAAMEQRADKLKIEIERLEGALLMLDDLLKLKMGE